MISQKLVSKSVLALLIFQLLSPFQLSLQFGNNGIPSVSVSTNETYAMSSACSVTIENAAWNFYYGGGGSNFGVFNKSGIEAGTTATPVGIGDITITLEDVNFNITNSPSNFTLSTVVHNSPTGNNEDGLYTHTLVNSSNIPGNNGNIQTSLQITTGKTNGPQTGTVGGVDISTLPPEDVYIMEASESFCNNVGGAYAGGGSATGSLTLNKIVINDATTPGTAVPADFTLTASGSTTSDILSGVEGVSGDVEAGEYDLSETALAGYTQTSLTCTGNATALSGSLLTVTAGEDITCTFTNDDDDTSSGTSPGALDTDGDNIPDEDDIDDDNDGILDTDEGYDVASSLINGDFEAPNMNCSPASFSIIRESNFPGWSHSTSGTRGKTCGSNTVPRVNNANIEIWTSGFGGVPAHNGSNQFVELNPSDPGILSQSITLPYVGSFVIEWSIAHRGRNGIETMSIGINEGGNSLVSQNVSAGNGAWVEHSGSSAFTSTTNTVDLAFESIGIAGGQGNFIDSVTTVLHIDTDRDGIPDHKDLDSDNDGISDLTESGVAVTIALDTDNNGTISPTETAGYTDGLANEAGAGSPVGTSLNLDSDADGIPDATEARPSTDYTAYPTTVDDSSDSDDDGILDIYDDNAVFGSTDTSFKTGTNTPNDDNDDSDGIPDYLDTDSDDDTILDTAESGTITGVSYANPDGNVDDPINGGTLPNVDNNNGGTDIDVDFRSVNLPLGNLTLNKVVINDETVPGTETVNDFILTASGVTTSDTLSGTGGVSDDILAGDYELSETTLAGYAQTSLVCTGNATALSGSLLTVADGETIVCTFTNDDQDTVPPTIDQDPLVEVTAANAATYPVSGTCTAPGDSISVVLSDGVNSTAPVATTCGADGKYSVVVDVSGLDDGNITSTSTIDDGVNPAVSDVDTIAKDTVVPTIDESPLTQIDDTTDLTAYTVSGTCTAPGDSVTTTMTDGATTATGATVTCSPTGTFTSTIDISGLDMTSTLNSTSTIDDGVNPAVSDTGSVTPDVTPPTLTQDSLVAVTAVNAAIYPVSGTCTAPGDSISVVLSDGVNSTAPVATTCGADGTYSVTVDVSGLDDGDITSTSTIDDGVNPAVSDDGTIEKDTVPPTITQTPPPAISDANASAYPVSGTCTAPGDNVTVTVTDSNGNTVIGTTICGTDGTYSVTLNVGSLTDGDINVNSTIDDGVNPPVSDDDDLDKDTSLPFITQNEPDDISDSNASAYPVSGTCSAEGDSVTITVLASNGVDTVTQTTTCGTGGTYTANLDVSGLGEGDVSITSTIDDGVNPPVSDNDTLEKDTTPPTITQNPLEEVSAANASAYPVSGTCTSLGDTITVVLTDANGNATAPVTTTCGSDGIYSVTVDVSGLDDGDITSTSTIDDGVNPAVSDTETVLKNTTLPAIVQDLLVEVTAANASAYPVSGTCSAPLDDITVVLSDGVNSTAPVATTCGTDGTYSVTVDVTSLDHGEVTSTSTIDDGLNPTVSDDGTISKDTGVPEIEHNDLSPITEANVSVYPVSGTCTAPGDSISVVLSDGVNSTTPVTTTCGVGGTYSVNVDASGLEDGNIDITSTIDDGVNPPVSDTDTVFKLVSSSSGGGGGGSSSRSSSSSSTPSTISYTPSVSSTQTPSIPEETETPDMPETPTEITPSEPELEPEEEEIVYSPQRFNASFVLPPLLPQTGTPLRERVQVLENAALELDPPSWAVPSVREDISFWRDEVLPFDQDKNADQYVVIPTLGVVAPINGLDPASVEYSDIVNDGTQIKDFSSQGGKNYLETLNNGVMQYPGTLPVGLEDENNLEYLGNSVIFGHSSYWKANTGRYNTIFGLLPTLDVGEEVWVYVKSGNSYELRKHVITSSYETDPSDVGVLSQDVYANKGVTLFTCTPIGGITGRWIIKAEYVKSVFVDSEDTSEEIPENEPFSNLSNRYKGAVESFMKGIESNDDNSEVRDQYEAINDRITAILPDYDDNEQITLILQYLQYRIVEKLQDM